MFFYFYIISQFFHFSTKKQAQRDTGSTQAVHIFLCLLLSKEMVDFKTTDESDENFSLESMLTRWITLYNMDSKYSIRSIFFVEMSSMISVTLFSRPISCRASSSVRFLFITTGRISLMISLICRFTTSLPDTKAVSPIPWPVLEVCFL